MNRRDFIKVAVAGSASLSLAAKATAASGRIPCGILGIDHAHGLDVFSVLSKSPDFELVGICEPDESVRQVFAANPRLKDTRWLTHDELLKNPDVRMIAVESAVPRLLPLARSAVDAGKHIHLDKPAGASLEEFQQLLDAAAKRELLLQMGYMFRYNPGFDFIRRALKEGWLGDVYSIHGSMCTDLTPEKRERVAVYPGGIMLELGCHLLDMVHLLLGPPSKVTPFVRHASALNDGLTDSAVAVLEYPKAIVSIETSALEPNAFSARRFKVAGTNGSIILSPLEPPAVRLALRRDVSEYKRGEHTIPFPDLERHVLDFADLAAGIRGERKFTYSKEHDLAVQKTILQASGMQA
ncbi:MAG: Gfo/Idh/MocA family oxidoreductase [Candidatus Hydrogenedentes bacterium]|nr:Gfo/Idh/MocA family oxidoreductase [Candidatus Hydrogenedentota bacterium]